MKLVTYTHNGESRLGALRGDEIIDLNKTDSEIPSDMLGLLRGGDAMMERAKAAAVSGAATASVEAVKLESPVPVPGKILAVALNYMQHYMELPEEIRKARFPEPPKTPVIFNKQSTSATGPKDPIFLPPESDELDFEAELAVVIGKTCRRVPRERAFEVVAGYTVLNDVTIRDWQRAAPTMTIGKSWDSHCPMGPALVTADEVSDPENLRVHLTVDGETRQDFNTNDMIIKIADQIAYLSTACTLQPGDVIATGTSSGVALWAPGQPWMTEGQVCRVEIDELGAIENTVVKESGETIIR
ncbi:MAG: fumarylacetoacetate hydrolase family protein, partial [Pseudomonadota bacterium]